jgi:hypothetical protein
MRHEGALPSLYLILRLFPTYIGLHGVAQDGREVRLLTLSFLRKPLIEDGRQGGRYLYLRRGGRGKLHTVG